MSNVVLTYYSDYGESFFNSLKDELLSEGNNVLQINLNNSMFYVSGWAGETDLLSEATFNEIRRFEPDLFISFNNSLPKSVFEEYKGNKPILVIDADNPNTFFNKEYLLRDYEYLTFGGVQLESRELLVKTFGILDEFGYFYLPAATAMRNKRLSSKYDISFIGSNFYPNNYLGDPLFFTPYAGYLYEQIKRNYYLSSEDVSRIMASKKETDNLIPTLRSFYAGQQRLKCLGVLSDLGLKIFGSRGWEKVGLYDLDLSLCFDPSPVNDNKQASDIYNSSNICLNISHPQAVSTFSWRVMDIMASSGCLVTEKKQAFEYLFGNYLSKETLDVITFNDRFELREKVKFLLSNSAIREKAVSELNFAIEENGRWKKRFETIEHYFLIPLTRNSNTNHNKNYSLELTSKDSLISCFDSSYISKSGLIKKKLSVDKRIKLLGALFLLFLSQIPYLGKMVPVERYNLIERSFNLLKK